MLPSILAENRKNFKSCNAFSLRKSKKEPSVFPKAPFLLCNYTPNFTVKLAITFRASQPLTASGKRAYTRSSNSLSTSL